MKLTTTTPPPVTTSRRYQSPRRISTLTRNIEHVWSSKTTLLRGVLVPISFDPSSLFLHLSVSYHTTPCRPGRLAGPIAVQNSSFALTLAPGAKTRYKDPKAQRVPSTSCVRNATTIV